VSGRRGQAVLRVARILLVSTPLSPGLWAVSGAAVRAPIEIEVVVERGTPAPGLGDTFLSPTSTFLGAHGSLAFEASLFDAQDPYLGDAVAIAGPDGSLELVAKAGDPAPAGGGTIEQLEVFGFNGAGQTSPSPVRTDSSRSSRRATRSSSPPAARSR
jgi:hypothetical protein